MGKGYVVHFGNDQAPTAIRAVPDRKTGKPTGEQFDQVIRVGTHQIINRARVWGRRVLANGETKLPDGSPIMYNDKGYRGEIEFLDWGAHGGHAIEIRYIAQSLSLDYEYQENVEKIRVDSTTGVVFLEFKTGPNEFDYKKDDLLIKFLKVYPTNRNSKSKNPDPLVKGFKFYEITEESVDQTSIKRIETAADAVNLVKDASNKPNNLRNLFKVLGGGSQPVEKFKNATVLSLDLELYKVILEYAEREPVDFFYTIDAYKRDLIDEFEKAKSFKALDLTKHGHIAFVYEGKPTLVFTDVKAKGEEMINWVVDNLYEEEVFKAVQIFKELVTKLK